MLFGAELRFILGKANIMVLYRTGNRNINVTSPFTDETVWRKALGNKEALLCFSVSGNSLDAPDHLPGGSLFNSQFGPSQTQAERY